jgi:hypothetical protein
MADCHILNSWQCLHYSGYICGDGTSEGKMGQTQKALTQSQGVYDEDDNGLADKNFQL